MGDLSGKESLLAFLAIKPRQIKPQGVTIAKIALHLRNRLWLCECELDFTFVSKYAPWERYFLTGSVCCLLHYKQTMALAKLSSEAQISNIEIG